VNPEYVFIDINQTKLTLNGINFINVSTKSAEFSFEDVVVEKEVFYVSSTEVYVYFNKGDFPA
jgi:hypothetical protein